MIFLQCVGVTDAAFVIDWLEVQCPDRFASTIFAARLLEAWISAAPIGEMPAAHHRFQATDAETRSDCFHRYYEVPVWHY